jgi:hypothetical protein
MTISLPIALADLELERAWIVYPGAENCPVHERMRVCSLPGVLSELPNGHRRTADGE